MQYISFIYLLYMKRQQKSSFVLLFCPADIVQGKCHWSLWGVFFVLLGQWNRFSLFDHSDKSKSYRNFSD